MLLIYYLQRILKQSQTILHNIANLGNVQYIPYVMTVLTSGNYKTNVTSIFNVPRMKSAVLMVVNYAACPYKKVFALVNGLLSSCSLRLLK